MQSALERRQEILEYLCQCRSTTRPILASKFNVTTKTIDRDLLVLTCSYPIFTQQGEGGGVYVQDGYYLNKQYLNNEQQQYLESLKANSSENDLKIIESIISSFGRNYK